MRLSPLITCATCLRATRDWHAVELRRDGAAIVAVRVCKPCASDVEDAVRRVMRERRAAAVGGG